MKIEIQNKYLQFVPTQSKVVFEKVVNSYAQRLIEEAGRLENTLNTNNAEPQITGAMISDADLLVSKGYSKKKTHWAWILAHTYVYLGGILAGSLFDLQNFQKDTTYLFVFLVVVITTAFVFLLSEFKERS